MRTFGTDPNGNPAIEFYDNENGDTYSLDIDRSQIFPTGEAFNLTPDANGTGTDITVSEPPVSYNSGYFGSFYVKIRSDRRRRRHRSLEHS